MFLEIIASQCFILFSTAGRVDMESVQGDKGRETAVLLKTCSINCTLQNALYLCTASAGLFSSYFWSINLRHIFVLPVNSCEVICLASFFGKDLPPFFFQQWNLCKVIFTWLRLHLQYKYICVYVLSERAFIWRLLFAICVDWDKCKSVLRLLIDCVCSSEWKKDKRPER